jgi:phosphonate transport system substrate-binding protein
MRFALTLDVDAPSTRAALATICELVSADTNQTIEPLVAASPAALAAVLAERRASFAWISPTLLLMTPELRTAVPLLSSVRDGTAFFHSVIFTAASRGIERLDQITGAHAAWVAPTSASGYLVPRLTLLDAGISLDALSRETFHDTHVGVARAVLRGEADIGATFAHFEKGDASGRLIDAGYDLAAGADQARVLAISKPIPADMIVSQSTVPISERVAFAGALCRLVHDPVGAAPFRTVIGADDFRPVSHQSLAHLERLMEAASRAGL